MTSIPATPLCVTDSACFDLNEIQAFLSDCLLLGADGGPALAVLTAIVPDGRTQTTTFADSAAAAAWAAARNKEQKGVYFQAAEPSGVLTSKMAEKAVARLWHLFADIDPFADMREDPATLSVWQEKTMLAVEALADRHGWQVHILMTGGGLCVLAPLAEPMTDVAAAKHLNHRFHLAFKDLGKMGGTYSPAHLMRLPGTVNWPNAQKRERGREPALARWVVETTGLNGQALLGSTLPAIEAPARRKTAAASPAPGLWALIGEREIEHVKAALAALPDAVVEDREQWIRLGAALHHWSGGAGDGWRIYDEWSSRAGNYGGTTEAWASFSLDRENGVTIGTLFHMAAAHGWTAAKVDDSEVKETPPRIMLDLGGNYMADYTQLVERVLIERDVRLYDRGGILVRLGVEHNIDANKVRTTTPLFIEVTDAHMRYVMSQHVDFRVFDAKAKKWLVKNPPNDLVKSLMARAGQWPYMPVATISATPTINSTGDLLDREGLDRDTGIFVLNPIVLPGLRLDKASAQQAVSVLKELVRECPFIDEPSRSVALSALITPVVRGGMDVAPAHAVTAPVAGTGKSYLFDMSAAIVTGMVCPAMSAGKSEEEMEKRLGAWALKGAPIIQIDNAVNDIGGDALCQLIERPMVNLRILGQSKMVRAQNRQTVFINGNNLVLYGDMVRRTLVASMDAGMERPGERAFAGRPLGEVMTRRGHYVAACITIVLSYFKAGRPDMGLTPMNSFQMWSDSVRSALVWCGEPDPCLTMERVRDNDPETAQLEALIDGMRTIGIDYENAASAAMLYDLSVGKALHEALQPWIYGAKFNANAFARWLNKHKDRRVGNFAIKRRSLDGYVRWYII